MAAIGLICKKKEGKKCSAFIIQYGHGGWANGLLLRAWICTSTTTSTTRQLKTQKADAAITAPNVYISLSIYCCSRFRFFFHSLSYLQIKYDRCEIKSSFFNSSTLFHHDNSVHLHSAHFCFFLSLFKQASLYCTVWVFKIIFLRFFMNSFFCFY